jgi:hypothetical protein
LCAPHSNVLAPIESGLAGISLEFLRIASKGIFAFRPDLSGSSLSGCFPVWLCVRVLQFLLPGKVLLLN